MKQVRSLIGILLVLVMLGSVIGTVIAIMTIKEIPNTKILNTVNDLRSNYEVYVAKSLLVRQVKSRNLSGSLEYSL